MTTTREALQLMYMVMRNRMVDMPDVRVLDELAPGFPNMEKLTQKIMNQMEADFQKAGLGGASSYVTRSQAALNEERERHYQQELARFTAVRERAEALRRSQMAVRNNPRSSSYTPRLVCTIERARNLFIFDAGGAPPVHFDMVQFAGCAPSYVPRLISSKLLQQWRLNGPWPSADDVSRAIADGKVVGAYQKTATTVSADSGAALSSFTPRAWLDHRVQEVAAYGE